MKTGDRKKQLTEERERVQEAKEQEAARKEIENQRTRDRGTDKDKEWLKYRIRKEGYQQERASSSSTNRKKRIKSTGN